jgi:hypothetical protein
VKQNALFPAPKKAPGKPAQDEWLKQLLETKTGGFRAAHWERCRNCDQLTLHGMDADIAAGMVTADPTPLSPLQELACIIVSRETYTLSPKKDSGAYELSDRQAAHRWGPRPPNHNGRLIVPAHQCGARFPGFIPRPATKETTNEHPPF